MRDEIRSALRQLVKHPGFTIAAALTFALGIGATSAIFSLGNSVLFDALPYTEPDRIVRVFETLPDGYRNTVSGGAYKDWRDNESVFEHLAVYEDARMNLVGNGTPQRIAGLRVSSEFLSVLGVTPAAGRDFAPDEDQPKGDNNVVLLTHRFSQQQFDGRNVIGESITLDQEPYTVIGVLPPDSLLQDDAMYLVPVVIDGEPGSWEREGHWRSVIGRLEDSATVEGANVELQTIKQRLNAQYPSFKQDWSVGVVPVQEVHAAEIRPTLFILFGTTAFLLLIACTNVANLLLVRGSDRAREIALRSALGASSGRLLRQMLLESLALALLGCVVGLVFAAAGVQLLGHLVADRLPDMLQPELDGNVLVFSVMVACACGLLFGLLPAMKAGRSNPGDALKENERGSISRERKRSQSLLLGAQFAFALVLLVGAGLMLHSFLLLLRADPGFEPQQALAFDISFSDTAYPDGDARLRAVEALVASVGQLPGIESVAVTSYAPLSNRGATEMLSRADRPFSADYVVGFESVSGEYLETLGIGLRQGRFLSANDNRSDASRVLVINSVVANDLYPGENPVGKQLRFFDESWEIIGVVDPVRHVALHIEPTPRIYAAHAHASWSTTIIVRTSPPPLSLLPSIRDAILGVDPAQPIANVRTLEQAVDEALAGHRTTLILLSVFAAVAILLTCIGIYGVVSYTIQRREREMGIRAVLGAQRGDIVRLVLGSGMRPSLAGIGVGLVAALVLSRFLESQLYAINAHDPVVFVVTPLLLAFIAVLSVYLPARRAADNEPVHALRQD